MADTTSELNERFAAPNETLSPEITTELQSILRIHDLPIDELSYKWESYCMKMGAETKLDLKTARDFKKDLQEILEREARSKTAHKVDKGRVAATPRAAGGSDAFNMLDSLVSGTPAPRHASTIKRKANFETPAPKASKPHRASSPTSAKAPSTAIRRFADREKVGEIDETINAHIEHPSIPETAPKEARIAKPKANTDLPKFAYKTMAMKLSEASELLDERIEEFVTLIQEHHKLDDSDLGDPTRSSQSEIVAVGRIASDMQDGKLNTASLVLESGRKRGNGVRIPLKVDKLASYDFFPGKIVALRGTNASGDFFAVSEILDIPPLMHVASTPADLDAFNSRLEDDAGNERALTVLVASGPYTTEDTLDFSPLQTLCIKAEELRADALILSGPFLDIEHALVRNGEFDLPESFVAPHKATLNDVFRYHISAPLQQLSKALPGVRILLVPSLRDAVSKHAAWPQDAFDKKELQLRSKQVSVLTNPITISLNEIMLGASSLDVLDQLRATGVNTGKGDFLARLVQNVLEQRHYFPVFPAVDRQSLDGSREKEKEDTDPDAMEVDAKTIGASLDVSYLKLGELSTGLDILTLPSVLKPFVKVRLFPFSLLFPLLETQHKRHTHQ